MHKKSDAANIFVFVTSYIVLVTLLIIFTFQVILPNFIEVEKKINNDHIEAVVSNVDKDITRMANSINDYSKWDDTYNFIATNNQEYIYDNFREETDTLEYLQVDGILFVTKSGKKLFSKYRFDTPLKGVEDKIAEEFKGIAEYASIISFGGKSFYFIKSAVLKSDGTGQSNGSIIAFKEITPKLLQSNNKVFGNIKIVNNSAQKDLKIQKKFTNFEIAVDVKLEKDYIKNTIYYFNSHNKNVVFVLSTRSERDIIKYTRDSIYLANVVLSLSLLLIFVILYKNQKLVDHKHDRLDGLVEERTEQLESAFRELKNKNKELFELAHTDFLTKTQNRGSFFQESEKRLSDAIKMDKEFSILLIDLDHFKRINDNYGHATGDKVLIEFCKIVTKLLDDKAIFGRIGGEEFCISFFDMSCDDVEIISENIRKKTKETSIDVDGTPIHFTISMGLSGREDFSDIDKIIHNADKLLYEAKQTGRDKLVRPFRKNNSNKES